MAAPPAEPVSEPSEAPAVRPRPGGGAARLPLLLGTMLVLGGISAFVWLSRPKSDVYEPPPTPPRTVAQIEGDMAEIRKNKNIPESEKQRILGFLKGDLEKAKQREAGGGETKAL